MRYKVLLKLTPCAEFENKFDAADYAVVLGERHSPQKAVLIDTMTNTVVPLSTKRPADWAAKS